MLSALGSLMVVVADTYNRRYRIVAQHLARNKFKVSDAPIERKGVIGPSYNERRLGELNEQGNGNIIIYGGYTPFVGSGELFNQWSFSVNVTQAPVDHSDAEPPEPFEIVQIHDHVT